ncbi:transketolase [Fibrobacter sp. UWEL]|uniref:transketolase family protein n=1 Tax=Fibrobacter sp. UWEL TaxID=1896209 RepID=UPI000918B565|nr:transketolase [Fibrobacter sp. UWEL]SHK57344.1 transketolase [Fibrobacter sp. UWEL]
MQDAIVTKAADNVRILSAAMVQKAKSGHPGGAMGAADAITLLFAEFLRFDPENPNWEARDRFFMDPGHMSALLYSELAIQGKLNMEDLKNFRQLNSRTPGHPEVDFALGIENSSGPLGIGHAVALGNAIAERFMVERFGDILNHKVVCLVSDGGLEEEIAYGVGRVAGHLKLSNLIFFYDANQVQLSCRCEDVMSHDFKKQYEAWGFRVIDVADGDHIASLREAFKAAWAETEKPTIVIGHTTMAKGAIAEDGKSFEGAVSTHGQPLNAAGASTDATVKNLGGDPADPFKIFPDVAEAFEARKAELRKEVEAWKKAKAAWDAANPEKAATLKDWLSGNAPKIDLSGLELKEGVATRVTSGTVLGHLAENVKNCICSSADLSNSDNTQAFLNKTGIFRANDFKGGFVQVGVAELTMGAICCGIALHGGLYPICATFFVFSDFMKPVLRMAALMGLPVKFMYTHDSFRVGEDGPTHEPIEHETQIRLLEGLKKTHGPNKGKSEMLVLRPADAFETVVAWEMAFENNDSPTTLILTRQNVKTLPGDRKVDAAKCRKGAYIVSDNCGSARPDLTFVSNGSDVLLTHDAAEVLRAEGLKVRVVSMISPALFQSQSKEYRDSIITPWTPVFAKSSGLPLLFAQVVGGFGKVSGLERFGASAPAGVLEKEFGYTPEAVVAEAKAYLAEYKANVAEFKAAN